MFCTKCGKEINEDAKFCIYCGSQVKHTEPIIESVESKEPAQHEEPIIESVETEEFVQKEEPIENKAKFEEKEPSAINVQKTVSKTKKKFSIWCILSIISLCSGIFTFFKGVDRLVNYDNGDYYPYEYVNAWVGGDAYNYIINGTHATAFFVLTAMFVLSAIGLLIVHYLADRKEM